jgi:diguanylate cyclase (GGDEF)-like protein
VLEPDPAAPHLLRVVASSPGQAPTVVDTRVESSAALTVMSRREAVFVPDAADCAFVNTRLVEHFGTQSALFLPLLAADGARGCITCSWSEPRMIRQDEIDLASFVASEVSAAWSRLEVEDRLRHQASRDSLTGLLNHAAFHDEVRRALAGLARDRGPVALILVDLDHLKHLNDFHGHAAGDAAIRAVADALRAAAREEDVLGRLGGDEFAWLLHGSPDDALAAAQRTVATFGATRLAAAGALSISAGVAVTTSSMEPEALFELADASLYLAKADGRGTAVLAGRAPAARPGRRDGDRAGRASGSRPRRGSRRRGPRRGAGLAGGVPRVGLCAVDTRGGRHRPAPAGRGLGRGARGRRRRRAAHPGPPPSAADALAGRTTYVCTIDDPDAEAAEVALLRHWNAGAVLVVPLLVGDRAVGVVELFDSRPRRFSGDERRLALTLAGYVAAALERALVAPSPVPPRSEAAVRAGGPA